MGDVWLVAISASVGAGIGILGTLLTNLFLVGQRRAAAVYRIVQAQRLVIEDLQAAYESGGRRPAVGDWVERFPGGTSSR